MVVFGYFGILGSFTLILIKHSQYIHLEAVHLSTNSHMLITMVYGFNFGTARKSLWDGLNLISSSATKPWIIMGDFNVVRSPDERLGPNPPSLQDIRDFNDCILSNSLTDIRSLGSDFSWTNKHEGTTRTWARLDRALVNLYWIQTYSTSSAEYLPPGVSDHSPVEVKLDLNSAPPKTGFQFLNCWISHPSFLDTVSKSWSTGNIYGTHMYCLMEKLKKLKGDLKHLHSLHFANLISRVSECRIKLQNCQEAIMMSPLDTDLLNEEQVLLAQFKKLKQAELSALNQRAKITHIRLDDCSTKYFYDRIAERHHCNYISQITDAQGVVHDTDTGVGAAFTSYYTQLLGTPRDRTDLDPDILASGRCLPSSEVQGLTKPIYRE
ncbi:uncharacterized protein LOC141630733 [Silene latifolia]|uniref:uncharacterized protein LOC141630733 n=1 Tax=Silene latifolia TaxID=37657 RepID=UPI003D771FAC